jgi:putative sigma-54 modulation protein
MRLNLSGHHVDVTPALRSYTERKLVRILRRFDRLIRVQCTLTVDKLRHRAESTVYVRGPAIHASAEAEDMYAAIDALADKLDRRVRKHKERLRDHHAPEAQKHGLAPAF